MDLDTPTLMIMESFVAACAGAILFVAWSQNRKISALALWGLANIVAAGGMFSLMLGPALHQPLWSVLGGTLLALAPGLMWKAARTLDAKPAPLVLALLGTAVVGLAGGVPGMRNFAGSLSLAASAPSICSPLRPLYGSARKERLAARGRSSS